MASEFSAVLFAAGVSDTKRRSESVEDGTTKIARLAEIRVRPSFIQGSQSLPGSPITTVEGLHVAGASPRVDGESGQSFVVVPHVHSALPSSSLLPPLPQYATASSHPSAVVSSSVMDLVMSSAREEVFIPRSDSLPSRFSTSASDVALALAASIKESFDMDGAVSDSLSPLFCVSAITHDAYGDQDDHVYRNNNNNSEFDVMPTSLFELQNPKGYIIPSASAANNSRLFAPSRPVSRVTASSSAPHQTDK